MFHFIEELTKKKIIVDNFELQEGDGKPFQIPTIVKASLLILDQMKSDGSLFNIIVLPDRRRFFFLITLAKLLYDIDQGKITHAYDPIKSFKKDDILRYETDYVQFIGVSNENGRKRINLRAKDDVILKYPIETMPILQKVDTNRRLTNGNKISKRCNELSKLSNKMSNHTPQRSFLLDLKRKLTHFENSMLCITPVVSFKDQLSRYSIGGEPLSEMLHIGRANINREISNVFKGQYSGNYAIILASDMEIAVRILEEGYAIESIVFEATNSIDHYYLDELVRYNRPILIVSDPVNAFELCSLVERDFKLWRWDKTNIPPALYADSSHIFDQRVKACANLKIEFQNLGFDDASSAMRLITKCGRNLESLSLTMTHIYAELYSLAFGMFRETIPFTENKQTEVQTKLEEARKYLLEEEKYIEQKTFDDYIQLVDSISTIYSPEYKNMKHNALLDYIIDCGKKQLCLIVPNNTDIEPVQNYWDDVCIQLDLKVEITVMRPSDYLALEIPLFDTVLISGWLNRNQMQRLLFSNKSEHFIVFLYRYEQRWKNSSLYVWKKSIAKSDNRSIVKSAMKFRDDVPIETYDDIIIIDSMDTDDGYDEQTLIEENLDKIRYKSYMLDYSDHSETTVPVEAIAVDFVGNYFAFYRENHKVIDVTNVLVEDESDEEKASEILAQKLKVGQFIVMRESGRDLIREIADDLLAHENRSELRELSARWKKALEHEQIHTGDRWIFEKLRKAGCKREEITMRNWLYDEDMISPQKLSVLSSNVRNFGLLYLSRSYCF